MLPLQRSYHAYVRLDALRGAVNHGALLAHVVAAAGKSFIASSSVEEIGGPISAHRARYEDVNR